MTEAHLYNKMLKENACVVISMLSENSIYKRPKPESTGPRSHPLILSPQTTPITIIFSSGFLPHIKFAGRPNVQVLKTSKSSHIYSWHQLGASGTQNN